MYLKTTPYEFIRKYFLDFQKHSKCFELPNDKAEILGIYEKDMLIGYFAIIAYQNGWLDIIHGYLDKEHRHKELPKEAMRLLEELAKQKGMHTIYLQTCNRFKSYIRFAKSLGYEPKRLIFSKEI